MGQLMSRVVSAIIRAGEIACATVVLAIMAYWMHKNSGLQVNQYSTKYWYSLGLAIVSIVVALILFPPLDHTFRYFPLDFILGAAWFAAFALLVIEFKGTTCAQGFGQNGQIALGGLCNQKRAAWGFAFLAGCFFIAGSVVEFWVYMRERKQKKRNTIVGDTITNRSN